jgi:hypothetical protein
LTIKLFGVIEEMTGVSSPTLKVADAAPTGVVIVIVCEVTEALAST